MGYRLFFSQIIPYIPLLLKGLLISIVISVIGMLLGSLLGVITAVGRFSHLKILRRVTDVYIEVFRNTPLLIQMYLLYFGLGQFDIQIPPLYSAIIAMVLNNGAYTAVIFEAGINAVDVGQTEAAKAIGMTAYQTFRYIILPQAFRIVVPPLTNQFISLFLFSSVAATISVNELIYQTLYVESTTMRTFETFIIATALYLVVTTIISVLSSLYERKNLKY